MRICKSKGLLLVIMLLPIMVLSCDFLIPPKQPDIINSQSPIWSATLTTGELLPGLCPSILYGNGIICLGSRANKSILRMFDKTSGRMIWEWDEAVGVFSVVKRVYAFQNVLVINNGPYIYGIDMNIGKTLWQWRNPNSASPEVRGIGEKYFIGDDNSLIVGDVFTGEHNSMPFGDKPSLFRSPIWYQSRETSDTLLLCGGRTYQNATDYFKTYLTSYNWSKKQTIYQLLQVEGSSSPELGFPGPGQSVISGNKVCIDIGRSIQCNDIVTGKLIWRRKFLGSFIFSSILAADNTIFGNCDDEGIMFALNAETGDIIWQEKTSSGSGDMLYMNGVIYIIGLGDGKLHALDAKTGKHLWKFHSPDNESSNNNSSFEDAVVGDGKNIYVRSYLHLYCFKAAK
ncbi:MAG: PQQ-binding-like beta-propeller repeat protein [Candidatus Kapabacteria bacterium]|nr:PQQ-binding-like beta-propeller repeat protein [Candidatus Kapabacteria bacterium]